MTPQEELAALRRLAELEAKAGGGVRAPQPTAMAGEGFQSNGATWGGKQNFAHGALQGLGDEVMAGTAAVKEAVTGGLPLGKAYDQALSMYRGARDQYREESPKTAAATEIGGSLATAIPAMALGGAGLKAAPGIIGRMAAPATSTAGKVAQYATIGSAPAAVYGFNEGEGGFSNRMDDAAKSGAIGGVAGVAAPYAVSAAGRVVQPIQSRLSGELERLAGVAADEGIPLTAAQSTGSKPLQVMESVFANMPMTSGPQAAISEAQRKAFNKAVLGKAGVNADNASPEVLDAAFKQIGARFDDVASRTNVAIDDVFHQNVAAVAQNYGRRLPTDVAPVFQSYMDDIAAMQAAAGQPGVAGVTVDGRAFQKVYSDLRRAARGASARPDLQEALNGLANSFDDAMARTGRNPSNLPLPPGSPLPMATNPADEWAAARGDYRNLLAIDKAMNSGTTAAVGGDIPTSALNQAVRQQGGYTRGRGDLNDLARVGNAFVRDNVPNSGTAQRMMIQNLMTGGAAGGAGYLGAGGDPTTGLATALAGLAGPRAVQAAYNSPMVKKYLTNQSIDTIVAPDIRQALARALAGVSGDISATQRK